MSNYETTDGCGLYVLCLPCMEVAIVRLRQSIKRERIAHDLHIKSATK